MKNYLFTFFVYITYMISFFLQISLTKNSNIILHISWLILILIYWILSYPYKINIINSFIIGLMIDFFTNYILGIHSLLLCIMTYFILYNHQFIIHLNVINKFLFIICILFIINFIIYTINDVNFNYLTLSLQSILNGCIWITMYFYLKKLYFRYKNFLLS
ncbi:rod shape-determining protein MreD [Enterobacteriaceae endosymbiont of Donacia provostii]|uniref:rod shape-determining protein MreD n=1 Tax=Enterobacteriaceae endosymbiont of Donacia provostii TaxID=2675781 RepID=UPI001448C572|nr:rod shape-determining protein MreD [Enterobacteriaceae endosymbiont of Donacia provostii]QJC33514.1 rod shape-determining protein MreD [Enterobacteriaceae endosymbiont of Donacia provostii]